MAPMGNRSRRGQRREAKREKTAKGVMSTKASAGMMWARVSAAWEAKASSRAAICGGPPRAGEARAKRRRRTTATAMTVQIQKPIRSQRGDLRGREGGRVVNFWTSRTTLKKILYLI